ncbi:hypothetical protein [Pseudorhodoplanes sp.]|uniref:hypothetical protein n=1 Tax=Pseudorhodoplanes sp. TaxID=1934341 RepID=UPI002CF486DB|nr:hypothetical protein [Pseudorhodoplanes sp.]HWV44157.1 hypothetical protein [Pseudorhodoplanes sp.]
MTTLTTPIIFGKRRAVIVGASWDKTSQRAHIVYKDETGAERTTRALGMSPRELRQAVLDELIHERWRQ